MRIVPLALAALVALGAAAAADSRATGVTNAELAVMVLPRSQLGPAARGLDVAIGSGFRANRAAVDDTLDPNDTPAGLARAGRLTGYRLEYADLGLQALKRKRGLSGITSSLDLFTSPAAAEAFLAKQVGDTRRYLGKFAESDLHLDDASTFPAPRVGTHAVGLREVGHLGSIRLYDTIVAFRAGPIVAAVDLERADAGRADADALRAARLLAARIGRVESGRLHERPVAVPRTARKGRTAPGGPDLATMALSPAGLRGVVTVADGGYVADDDYLADYERKLRGAIRVGGSTVASLESDVFLLRSAQEAGGLFFQVETLYLAPEANRFFAKSLGVPASVTTVEARKPLSAGDESYTIAIRATVKGQEIRFTQTVVRVGPVLGILTAAALSPSLRAADVEPLATELAQRIARGL